MRWEKGICWFRRDLRVFDNRALSEATRHCKSVYTVFIFDTCIIGGLKKNDRRMSFIWASVEELKQKIKDKGGRLITLYGDPKILVPRLARSLRVDAVFAGEDYEPKSIERDEAVRRKLESEQQRLILLKDHVVHTPVEVLKDDGSAYRVFTPYSKVWKKRVSIDLVSIARLGQGVLKKTKLPSDDFKSPRSLASIGFEEQKLKFDPGESSGRKTFNKFKSKIDSYHKLRDFPAEDGGSHLSVYLRFGNISIRELVRFCLKENSAGISVWLNELIWLSLIHI